MDVGTWKIRVYFSDAIFNDWSKVWNMSSDFCISWHDGNSRKRVQSFAIDVLELWISWNMAIFSSGVNLWAWKLSFVNLKLISSVIRGRLPGRQVSKFSSCVIDGGGWCTIAMIWHLGAALIVLYNGMLYSMVINTIILYLVWFVVCASNWMLA